MNTITIAPLATPGNMTEAAKSAICTAGKLFLQTALHPSAQWIIKSGAPFATMDDLYEQCCDFDQLNDAIAQRLISAGDAVYAPPGRGLGAEQLLAIRKAAEAVGTRLISLPSCGYAEAAMASIPDFPLNAQKSVLCPSNGLPTVIDPYLALLIEELDTPIRASEVKLALGEYYPDDYPLWFCFMERSGLYTAARIPLYELDRQEQYFAATCCILPAAEPGTLPRSGMEDLMRVMRRLRAPGGCPWDAEQTHSTLRTSLIEEAYEVLDAIDRDDMDALCEELGDLLLQVVFHAVIEEERSVFNFRDVASGIVNKLVYRHPHVFGAVNVQNSDEVLFNWEQLKKEEKHFSSVTETMYAVPAVFPALMRSAKIQKKAAHAGFDWPCAQDAMHKIAEEANELAEAITDGNPAWIDEECGDLLFATVNVIRLLKRDPEAMLRQATDKFVERFARMEALIQKERGNMENMSLEQMDEYWDRVKSMKN